MNTRAIKAIIQRDLRIITKTKGVLWPMIIVPLVMLVVVPTIILVIPAVELGIASELDELGAMIGSLPEGLRQSLASYTPEQQWIVVTVLYLLAPMYLIAPLMVASVIAADSFAGEKERKTLEALLYTPTTDLELYLAKLLSAWLPAVAIAWIGFVIYGLVVNIGGWPVMRRVFFPNLTWVLLAVWVSPAIAAFSLGVSVLVSVRVSSFQEAYQMGAIVVVLVVALMIGQLAGVLVFSPGLVAAMGAVLWAVDAVLLWVGGRSFQRGQVLARL